MSDKENTAEEKNELLPCPLCGGEAKIVKIDGDIVANTSCDKAVQCRACALLLPLLSYESHGLPEEGQVIKLTQKWNDRMSKVGEMCHSH